MSHAVTDPIARVTVDENGEQTKAPQPKVVAGTVGAGVGAAVTTLAVYIIESTAHIDLPIGVELAGGVLIGAVVTFLAGYIKRP